ncbi:MAG: CRTAC1 family protein [Acidimicrobiia bacterium]|nr:CRTAC1 family protein [Acidimicrobiia bacterium]
MRCVLVIAAWCVAACAPPPEPGKGAASPPTAAAPWFEDVAAARGITFAHRSGHETRHPLPEIMGGGAALLDIDGDGDLDALFIQSGRLSAQEGAPAGHHLYRNRGDGTFEDVSAGSGIAAVAGYGMGAATGDYDNDGDVDVYVTNLGANVLLQNDGRGRFADVTRLAGVAGSGWSTSAAFVDVDADADLDLFVTRYLDWHSEIERECYSLTGVADYCSPKNYDAPTSDLLFRNNGNGTFTDVSRASGLATAVGNGLGVIADDVNGDGRVDVFVANDGTPNHLWMNQGGGRFVESALMSGVAIDQDGAPKAGMGVHAADVDDDGDNELIVMNLDTESDSFFRNQGKFFVDDTVNAGLRIVSRRFTRFGVAFMDFDNDGRLDLYEANGRVGLQAETFSADPYAEPNLLFRGTTEGRFEEVTPRGGTAPALVATSRAAAFGDLDNDGGIDIVVANRDAAPHVLRNVAPGRGRWLLLRVLERNGRDAIGATLSIAAGGRTLRRDVRTGYSYLAANDPRIHVGLGGLTNVESVTVHWADGSQQRFGPFDADRIVELRRRQ